MLLVSDYVTRSEGKPAGKILVLQKSDFTAARTVATFSSISMIFFKDFKASTDPIHLRGLFGPDFEDVDLSLMRFIEGVCHPVNTFTAS